MSWSFVILLLGLGCLGLLAFIAWLEYTRG